MTTNWLDEMPPIPLATSVPVRGVQGGSGTVLDTDERDGTVWVQYAPPAGRLAIGGEWLPGDEVRVDLSDDLGFAYALRWRWMQAPESTRPGRGGRSMSLSPGGLSRWLNGEITDADRLELARACREARP